MINRGRGIRTVWVGQILNLAALNDDKIYGWLPFVRDRDVWPLLSRFNAELRDEAEVPGRPYIEVEPGRLHARTISSTRAISARRERSKFARLIAPQVAEACRR